MSENKETKNEANNYTSQPIKIDDVFIYNMMHHLSYGVMKKLRLTNKYMHDVIKNSEYIKKRIFDLFWRYKGSGTWTGWLLDSQQEGLWKSNTKIVDYCTYKNNEIVRSLTYSPSYCNRCRKHTYIYTTNHSSHRVCAINVLHAYWKIIIHKIKQDIDPCYFHITQTKPYGW